ncbi:hypothetical protein Tco_0272317 [Tanacetum coccineum]
MEKVGCGSNTLLEQWKETYENDEYDFDPYDDDMYENQDTPDKIQAICDNLDIKVRGRPSLGIAFGDELWAARYILEIAEVVVSFYPSLFPTKSMREEGGYEIIKKAIEKLGLRHKEYIAAYGEGNEHRLTGRHETADINTFKWTNLFFDHVKIGNLSRVRKFSRVARESSRSAVATLRALVHAGDKTGGDARCVINKEEAPLEEEESQPLGSRVPLMSEEFEASKPSSTRTVSSHSPVSSDSTTPLSPDHPLTHVSPTPTPTRVSFHHRTARIVMRTQPTLSPGMSARIAEAASLTLSSFRKRYRSSYDTSSSSPTLPVRKRYREGQDLDDEGQDLDDEGQGLDDEGQGLEDEGPGMEEEEAAPEGQQQAVPVVDAASSRSVPERQGAERVSAFRQPTLDTWVDHKDDRVYTDIPAYAPPAAPVQTPPSPEWSLGSLPVSPSSPVVPSPIASTVATPTATISVDEDQFIKVGAQLDLHGSILHDHTQRLDELPLTLVVDIDRDVRELYTRSGAVRDEIFSQRSECVGHTPLRGLSPLNRTTEGLDVVKGSKSFVDTSRTGSYLDT